MAVTYRGLTAEARSGRCGLLLCPRGPLDGDLLGVRTAAATEPLPGRGVLAVRGLATPVQVPLP
jgi:DNA segregation ATPase FtsK/SpoIIIE, S-DNA-T family